MIFKLEKPVSLKKKILFPLGIFAIFFLTNLFFRNVYTSGVLVISILAFAVYSFITERKHFIEFHRDNLEFKSPSGKLIFFESIYNLKFSKAELRDQNRVLGQAVVIMNNSGKRISIATYSIAGKWKGQIEQLNEVDYILNPIKWPDFIERLELQDETEKQSPTSHDMQQQAAMQKKILHFGFWMIFGTAIVFMLIFGSIFGWILLTQ